MGRTVGVVHATGERDAEFDEAAIHDLATLANLAGARIGLLRMVADTQLQAATDSLTGLLNRRSLENRVRLLRADDIGYTVVMADLDHFKALNDTYGHETGDRALRLFAQTLKAGLRNTDLVCRHGGEEFAVVLPDCRALDAHAAMQLFQTKLTDAARSSGLPSFTASFGVVEARDTEDLAAAIARADGALFQAKQDGRNQIVVHDTAGNDVAFPQYTADAAEAFLRTGDPVTPDEVLYTSLRADPAPRDDDAFRPFRAGPIRGIIRGRFGANGRAHPDRGPRRVPPGGAGTGVHHASSTTRQCSARVRDRRRRGPGAPRSRAPSAAP